MNKTFFLALAAAASLSMGASAHSDHDHNIGHELLSDHESAHMQTSKLEGKAVTTATLIEEAFVPAGSVEIPTIYGTGAKAATTKTNRVVLVPNGWEPMAKPLSPKEAEVIAKTAEKERKEAMKALKKAQKKQKMTAKEAYAALSPAQKALVDAQWEKARKAAIAEKEAAALERKMAAEKARVQANMEAAKEKLPKTKADCADCKTGKKCAKCHKAKACEKCRDGKKCAKCKKSNFGHKRHNHAQDIDFANDPMLLQEAM